MTLNVLVVDDHELARHSLSLIVSTIEGYTVCGELAHGTAVIPFVSANSVDIVLLDLNLGTMNGLTLLTDLVERCDITVVVISGEDSAKAYKQALVMGARAIVSKSDPLSEIENAIKSVACGENYFSPTAKNLILEPIPSRHFSPRQTVILQLLSEGISNKEISYQLKISMPTVSFHLKEIRTKIGAASNRQIILTATQLGLI
ncbi:MAG: DNA-binding NarL/FixJ family response regulator [Oceanicoccus sp.]|jgi:DNA-binding NarL/FixJ family response regulator